MRLYVFISRKSTIKSNLFSKKSRAFLRALNTPFFMQKKGVYFYQKSPKIYAFITLWITKTLVDNYAFSTPKHTFVMKISHKNASKTSVLSKN